MRCPDLVMSAMSYHPRHRLGKVARRYWSFVADWQRGDGFLHTRGGQWHLIELASRFRFRSVRRILKKSLPYAALRQRDDGCFQAGCAAESACLALLSYARHGGLAALLDALPYDPTPLVMSLDTPLGIKTRSKALRKARQEDCQRSKRIIRRSLSKQRRDGSWEGLVLATAQSLQDLLDCGVMPEEPPIRHGCRLTVTQFGEEGRRKGCIIREVATSPNPVATAESSPCHSTSSCSSSPPYSRPGASPVSACSRWGRWG